MRLVSNPVIIEGTSAAEAKLDNFAPDNPELRNRVALLRIGLDDKLSSLQKLAKMQANPEFKTLEAYAYYCATHEPAPHRALEYAFEALKTLELPGANSYFYTDSLRIALMHLKSLGREDEGLLLLRRALIDGRRIVRADAAIRLAQHLSAAPKLVRAALAAFAASEHAEGGTLLAAARILYESGPTPLMVYIAHLADAQEKSASAHLYLGLAYSAAKLKSLAYSKYKSAVAGKVSVAKANLAQLFATGPVPGAGLDLLQEHEGQFDSSSPGHPYSTRAELEEAVHAEREEAQVLIEAGRASLAVLAEVIDSNVRAPDPRRIRAGEYSSTQGAKYTATYDANQRVRLSTVAPGKAVVCWEGIALPGLVFITQLSDELLGVAVAEPEDRFAIYWFGSSGVPKRDRFDRIPDSRESATIGELLPEAMPS